MKYKATRFIYMQYWGLILLSCVRSVSEQSALSVSGLSVLTIQDGIFYKQISKLMLQFNCSRIKKTGKRKENFAHKYFGVSGWKVSTIRRQNLKGFKIMVSYIFQYPIHSVVPSSISQLASPRLLFLFIYFFFSFSLFLFSSILFPLLHSKTGIRQYHFKAREDAGDREWKGRPAPDSHCYSCFAIWAVQYGGFLLLDPKWTGLIIKGAPWIWMHLRALSSVS